MKQLTATVLSVVMVGQLAGAGTLMQYRQTVLKDPGVSYAQVRTEAADRVKSLRSLLGTSNDEISELADLKPATSSVSRRFFSSLILKDMMDISTIALIHSEKYGSTPFFDPSWTPDEHKMVLKRHQNRLCIQAVESSRSATATLNPMDQILNDITGQLIFPENRRAALGQNEDQIISQNRESDQKLISMIEGYLSGGKNQVLGKLVAVEYANGVPNRLQFQNGDKVIYASLPMLLTYRLGEDDALLEIQNCLVDYLKEQKEVYSKRVTEISQGAVSQKWTALREYLKSSMQQLLGSQQQMMKGAANPTAVQEEIKEIQEQILDRDDLRRYQANLKAFYEGRVFKSTDEELKVIQHRIELINIVVPFLQRKNQGAMVVNSTLKKLSTAQVNRMINMFLLLQGDDILTRGETAKIGSSFQNLPQNSSSDVAQQESLRADFIYYRIVGRQLTDLENLVREETINAQSRKADLERIRSAAR
jgi:hypothetical protein